MILYIKPPNMNDSLSRLVLDNKEYLARFTYNSSADFWTFAIYDTEERIILQHRKIVPVSPLNNFDVQAAMPSGIFGCLTDQQHIGRDSFKNGSAEFVYIPWNDLKEWSEENGIIR